MTAFIFSMLLTGVLLNAGAQLLLKAGTNAVGRFEFATANIVPIGWRLATEPHIMGGMVCYVLSLAVWIVGLSRVPVSVAYPMLSIGYVVNVLAAWWLFGEAITPMKLAGISFIIVGVWLVARS